MKEEMEQIIDPKEVGQEKKSKIWLLVKIFIFLFFIFAISQIVLGYINLQQIHQEKKPYLLISQKEYQQEESVTKVYYFGIYKVVKTDTESKTTTSLKPWFFDDEKEFK